METAAKAGAIAAFNQFLTQVTAFNRTMAASCRAWWWGRN